MAVLDYYVELGIGGQKDPRGALPIGGANHNSSHEIKEQHP